MLDIHDCTNKGERDFEVCKSSNNVNNAIYLLETNKNIYMNYVKNKMYFQFTQFNFYAKRKDGKIEVYKIIKKEKNTIMYSYNERKIDMLQYVTKNGIIYSKFRDKCIR